MKSREKTTLRSLHGKFQSGWRSDNSVESLTRVVLASPAAGGEPQDNGGGDKKERRDEDGTETRRSGQARTRHDDVRSVRRRRGLRGAKAESSRCDSINDTTGGNA